MSNESVFRYRYSAAQNSEVRSIREKYLPRQESKLDVLRRLDRRVQSAGMAEALSIGAAGCLLFGLGLCIALHVLGGSTLLGAFIGVWGMVIMLLAYPVWHACSHKAKMKYRPRILELAAQLSGEANEL